MKSKLISIHELRGCHHLHLWLGLLLVHILWRNLGWYNHLLGSLLHIVLLRRYHWCLHLWIIKLLLNSRLLETHHLHSCLHRLCQKRSLNWSLRCWWFCWESLKTAEPLNYIRVTTSFCKVGPSKFINFALNCISWLRWIKRRCIIWSSWFFLNLCRR